MLKRFLCSLLLVLSLLTGTALAADFSDLVILHTNDTHGYDQRADGINGMATVAAIRQDLLAQGKQVLLVDAGDAIQDNNLVNFSKGASAMQFMNAVGYDAMCLGNHEFDYGQDVTLQRVSEAHFPMLACNIVVKATNKLFVKPSTVVEKGKHKIGIVGITTPEAATSASPMAVAGLEFLQGEVLYTAVQCEVDKLKRQHCDLIVAVGHMGSENFNEGNRSDDVLKHVHGIDVFIDGHDHQVKNRYIGGTMLTETGSYTKNIGQVVWKDGKWQEDLLAFDANRPQNAQVQQLIDKVAADVDAKLSEPIGKVAFTLDGSRDPGVRTQEMDAGDFVADAFLWQANQAMVIDGVKVDAAILNGGGIRASIPSGTVTLGSIARRALQQRGLCHDAQGQGFARDA